MKAKRVLSAAFAAGMVFSTLFSTPVMAEEIDSDTVYIDQEIIDVTLPTTASQRFYIDPQGLIAVGQGGGATPAPGTVTGASDMYAVNRSSIPLALSVSYTLKDSVKSNGVTVVSSVADADAIKAIQDAAGKQIAVSVSAVESGTDAASNGNTCGGKVFKAGGTAVDMTGATGMTTADVVYAGTTAATADYLMTAETYEAQMKDGATDIYDSNSYEYVIDPDADAASCVKLTIGGYCSTKADWSDYANGTESLKLDVVFTFKKVATTTGDYKDATVGTDEVSVGPKVTITTGGLITISGLTAEKNFNDYPDIVVGDATDSYAIQADNAPFDGSLGWTTENGGACTFQLQGGWTSWTGRTVTVTVTLKDGSTITSAPVTLAFTQ